MATRTPKVQPAPAQTPATPKPEFNSEPARQYAAELLDQWATEHHEAAVALKALAQRLVRTEQVVGWKVFGFELMALEV